MGGMTTNEKITLAWGCKRGLPEGVTAAYGERKIAPFDRGRADWQGSEAQLGALEQWLNRGRADGEGADAQTPVRQARTKAVEMRLGLGDGPYGARCEDVVTLFEDEAGKIVASPQGSHGYVYIAAWLFDHIEQ